MPRKLDAILAEAVKLINPRKDSVEAFRAQLKALIECVRDIHQRDADVPPPGERKALWADYLKALQRVREKASVVKRFRPGETDDFNEALEHEIHRADVTAACLVVRKNDGPQRDKATADVATIMARGLIDPDPNWHPENRGKNLPAIDCPWRQPVTLTRGGAWLDLASLIFEGATGIRGRDMMEYCSEIKQQHPPPRYRVLIPAETAEWTTDEAGNSTRIIISR
jgi:hypothetical protein